MIILDTQTRLIIECAHSHKSNPFCYTRDTRGYIVEVDDWRTAISNLPTPNKDWNSQIEITVSKNGNSRSFETDLRSTRDTLIERTEILINKVQ